MFVLSTEWTPEFEIAENFVWSRKSTYSTHSPNGMLNLAIELKARYHNVKVAWLNVFYNSVELKFSRDTL